MKIYITGKLVEESEAMISVFDHGFYTVMVFLRELESTIIEFFY